ncbi:hypothetical protein [Patulibacter minatonensis]|uniref:hypothetical protein n=1 Tax=Patulibacter minatonensis TaxID=298163 RepID=UPI0012F755CB|nr:hypothetical protein [Patulibacter minatonensis]
MRNRLFPLLAVALASTALTACGEKEDVVTHAETEAVYVSVGPKDGPYLKYQVQVSRQLNPGDFENLSARGDQEKIDPEDSEYLKGIPQDALKLTKNPKKPLDDEVYFGVFIQVANDTKKPLQSAALSGFEIKDSQWTEGDPQAEKHVYLPIAAVSPKDPGNPFLYRQAIVPAATGTGSGYQPLANSPAGSSTTAAELLVFKIPQANLENRPLVLHIKGPTGGEAEVDLDV